MKLTPVSIDLAVLVDVYHELAWWNIALRSRPCRSSIQRALPPKASRLENPTCERLSQWGIEPWIMNGEGLNTYYWIYYQDVGVADAEYDRDPKDTLQRTLYTFSGDVPDSEINRRILEPGKGALDSTLEPEHLPPWLTESDLDYMASDLKRNGFRNPLNYYRNIDRNWQLLAPWTAAVIHQPALFIAGKEDHVIRGPTGEKQLKDLPTTVPGLKRTVLLDGAGHYIQQERPKEVNTALLDFLREMRAS